VLDQTDVTKLRSNVGSYMADQATYIPGEGDVTKRDQDDYHPIRIKECGIHQGNLMDIKNEVIRSKDESLS
jgi:hypothetical protein